MLLLCGCGTLAAASFQAAPGDFNQDGQTDLAVLGSGEQVGNQTRYRLEVFHGGATHPVVLDTFEASWHSKLVARDIDGDQDADLILFSASGTPTKVWINDGAGNLQAQVPSSEVRPESPTALLPGLPVVPVLRCVVAPAPNVLPRPAPGDERLQTEYARFAPASFTPSASTLTVALFNRPPPSLRRF
jgi:hypothetical protein